MSTAISSLQVIRSSHMGGAERWFVRFLRAMQAHGSPVEAVVRNGSELLQHHLDGIPTHALPMRSAWDPLSRWQMSRCIRHSGLPLVQTYMERATRLVHLPPGGPVVHLARLGSNHRSLEPLRHAHAWVCNTEHLCEHLRQNGFAPERVFHICNFADPAPQVTADTLAGLRATHDIAADDFLLLCAGRMVGFKGHATLLAAFARLPAEIGGRRLRLALVGDGPLRSELEAQAHQLNIESRLIWTGWQQDPAPWFRLAQMVVMPSREVEVLGNVILEAWSYGLPLLATTFRGARETVRHGEDGWLSPCDEPVALAEAAQMLLQDDALRQTLASNGLQRVTRDYSPAAITTQYQALYQHLLAGH